MVAGCLLGPGRIGSTRVMDVTDSVVVGKRAAAVVALLFVIDLFRPLPKQPHSLFLHNIRLSHRLSLPLAFIVTRTPGGIYLPLRYRRERDATTEINSGEQQL